MEFSNLSDALRYINTTSGPEARRRELRRKQRQEIEMIRSRNDWNRIGSDYGHDQGHHHHEPFWFAVLEANGIWREVFEYIDDPSDITSAYHSCDLFRCHLQKKWNMMTLLPKVFRVLSEGNYLRYIEFRTYELYMEELPDDEFPSPGILNLRLVSKMWKQGMEDGSLAPADFSQPDWHLNDPYDAIYTRYAAKGCLLVHFRRTEDVDRMMNAFGPPNSPLARCISVSDDKCGDRENFYDRIEQFLEFQGKSAWALQILQYIRRDDDFTFDYDNLHKLVRHTPNLKELEFYIFCQGESLRDGEEMRLRENFQRFPFPTIPSLKRVLCTFDDFIHEPVLHEIVRANPDMKAVSICCENPPDFNRRLISTLGNLSSLECFQIFGPGHQQPPLTLEHIQPLREVQWPCLKTLYFWPSLNPDVLSRVSAAELFRFLSHFKKSLEKVVVEKGVWDIFDDKGRSILIDFPHLRNIQIG